MGYPYEETSATTSPQPADAIEANNGKCPPVDREFRIYPEYDFTELFGLPPITVVYN
jgi:hypothetical protein